MQNQARVDTVEKLREFVRFTLCEQNSLEVEAFPFTEKPLSQAGRQCGLYFCLHGPRSVKFIAIWDSDKNTVLFYSCNGERLLKAPVSVSERVAT